jgi:predicted solute-binding protein
MTFERRRRAENAELMKLKKEVIADDKVMLTLLIDKRDRIKLKGIAASKQTTMTNILCDYIKEYIQRYRDTDV